LHTAAGSGNIECVETLLHRCATIDLKESTGGCTALHIAASRGRNETVMRLLQSGADINIADNLGFTALCQSAINEYPETCKLLLQNGAEVDRGTSEGRTPLHLAAVSGNLRTVRVLVEYPSALIKELKTAIVVILCDELKLLPQDLANAITELAVPFCDVTTKDCKGITALDIAQDKGLLDIVEYISPLMSDIS